MAICNLSPIAFILIACFELLNQWYGAELGIQEFKVLHNIWRGFDNHYYFIARPNFVWESYIFDIPWQDTDWFKDILVANRD